MKPRILHLTADEQEALQLAADGVPPLAAANVMGVPLIKYLTLQESAAAKLSDKWRTNELGVFRNLLVALLILLSAWTPLTGVDMRRPSKTTVRVARVKREI